MTWPATTTELVITRTFDAPRADVYQAFTDPDRLAQWFGPEGFSVPRQSVEIDARVGGRQRFVMVSDDDPDSKSAVDALFTEVVRDELLAGRQDWEGVPGTQEPVGMYLRLHFADEAGKTRLALRQGPYTQELACLAREGWISSFSKLDALLAGLGPGVPTGGTSGAASPGATPAHLSATPARLGDSRLRHPALRSGAMKRSAATALSALVMLAGLAPPMPSAVAAVRTAAPAAVMTAAPAAMPRSSACVAHWGSTPKHAGKMARSHVLRVRAGQHACFDRLVIDIGRGAKPGYLVRYVARVVQDPSGQVIHLRGGAKLHITVLAPAGGGFRANRHELVRVAGFQTFRQVAGAGSFEGVTSVGLGVRARLPFRVLVLNGPGHQSRLVIDVAHHWYR